MSTLDPHAQALLDAAAGSPPIWTLPVARARERMRAIHATGGRDDVATEDLEVAGPAGGIPVRVYRTDAAPHPVLVFLHGGGWILDDLDTHELLAGTLAAVGGLIVVSVDYRRAPEHPFPAALEDAVAVVRWAAAAGIAELGGDGTLAVGGDSAGGNLAAASALVLRDAGGPELAAQLLLYPVLDVPRDTGSYREHATGTSLTRAFMDWAFDAYAPPGVDRDDPLLVPARARVDGLPPTRIVTAGFDPLRDEGIAWARALADAGVPVRAWHADDQMHGFAGRLREIPRAAALVDEVARELGDLLRSRTALRR